MTKHACGVAVVLALAAPAGRGEDEAKAVQERLAALEAQLARIEAMVREGGGEREPVRDLDALLAAARKGDAKARAQLTAIAADIAKALGTPSRKSAEGEGRKREILARIARQEARLGRARAADRRDEVDAIEEEIFRLHWAGSLLERLGELREARNAADRAGRRDELERIEREIRELERAAEELLAAPKKAPPRREAGERERSPPAPAAADAENLDEALRRLEAELKRLEAGIGPR
ncbi:MAG: hypothetical protein ACT4PV_04415 [Planctomycetaceae bacterium]